MSDRALPAWAREDAFPLKPEDSEYGFRDQRGKLTNFDSLKNFKDYIAAGKGTLAWVWVPEHDRFVAPEEVPALAVSLKKRRALLAVDDSEAGRKGLFIFAVALCYFGYQAFSKGGWEAVSASQNIGIGAILLLIFGVRPWWEGRQGQREIPKTTPESIAEEIPEARFELWLSSQTSRLTILLCGLLVAVFVVQFFTEGIAQAGLVKQAFAAGEWWRLYTGAFLHGNIVHLGMNLSALWYLGRRTEILARWPHLANVFILSIFGSGWATTTWIPEGTSVGVSGAVCGLLGFLLVFETLHRPLVPSPARHRLLGILVSLVVIGFFGYGFIDNAAHLGGLITGAVYAAIVFPKSASLSRPHILKQDRIMGSITLGLVVLFGLGAIVIMLVN
ncbi:rhomboid family intramembrane serine protease [Akkermansiaceae bacterium]|nr:rhomboid family intramembrane serine protease [Akkermansiaceae bacterium]MDB4287341.1 rhomboid family intramembrane serine protease [bacterium]MDA7629653.1 rhomboid family intramembrane serine protease [Akkermansiaceae bacterium]MDA8959948.1 rhomboid family intramembrane serine protease [Akkermansiaceae bacterium]MDA8991862.1 rhomboid family intramembrane serine protease [Akkermansiaceae bacterium]